MPIADFYTIVFSYIWRDTVPDMIWIVMLGFVPQANLRGERSHSCNICLTRSHFQPT
ncbi:hypothetical protein [Coleofasciculus sp. F4-SAH-05]|uniref:hypothetical protein n=1 Tax=Coleofasciculus sp. F4-SAH-05 TaxID=3069525 RepID=UPI00330231CE